MSVMTTMVPLEVFGVSAVGSGAALSKGLEETRNHYNISQRSG
jgi:hypothetical protein